eukprot:357853-Chlamydomonas_euryale.AAC.3
MTVVELRAQLRARGLPDQAGRKAALVERLAAAVTADTAAVAGGAAAPLFVVLDAGSDGGGSSCDDVDVAEAMLRDGLSVSLVHAPATPAAPRAAVVPSGKRARGRAGRACTSGPRGAAPDDVKPGTAELEMLSAKVRCRSHRGRRSLPFPPLLHHFPPPFPPFPRHLASVSPPCIQPAS